MAKAWILRSAVSSPSSLQNIPQAWLIASDTAYTLADHKRDRGHLSQPVLFLPEKTGSEIMEAAHLALKTQLFHILCKIKYVRKLNN